MTKFLWLGYKPLFFSPTLFQDVPIRLRHPFLGRKAQFSPPKATFTESNLPDLSGKVYIVTGGSSGIGFELSRILYCAGGTVYILTPTPSSTKEAIEKIKDSSRGYASSGSLKFIHMDLEDLASVQAAAKEFSKLETRLDVLFNNAGVGHVTNKQKTKQGIEIHLGVNAVGHFLLQKLLQPILAATAKASPLGTVRVVWSSSVMVELCAPKGGIRFESLENPDKQIDEHYSASKAACWFLASEFSRRHGKETDILSIAGNPGSYVTNAYRSTPWYIYYAFWPSFRYPIHGAWTNLWMGFSGDVTLEEAVAGRYATCDGRWHPRQREDLIRALRGREEGGTGQAEEFYERCEQRVAPFADM